jgi:hypothetical protein
MKRGSSCIVLLAFVVGVAPACSASGGRSGGSLSSDGGGDGNSAGDGSGSSSGSSSDADLSTTDSGEVFNRGADSGTDASGTPGGTCIVTANQVDEDMDHDGWTTARGDCNDCNPYVNPGAIDVLHPVDGGTPYYTDDDCDGVAGDVGPCDTGLALDDTVATDAALALDLCRTATPTGRTWGVLSAQYIRADGTAFAPSTQVGLQDGFGPHVHVQRGSTMLALSSGHARLPSQAGACGSNSCMENAMGTPPPGFPQNNPSCPPSPNITDDVGLSITLRVPTNATGYHFGFKFYSFEYPAYVCASYNDQFITLASPAPMGSINGNIAFDGKRSPVSVNLGYFDVCDPTAIGTFAGGCIGSACPQPPNPYCPAGTAELAETGFDLWAPSSTPYGGATSWLQTEAPVLPGSELTIKFIIWDTGDQSLDSTVLLDDFEWITASYTIVPRTYPTF